MILQISSLCTIKIPNQYTAKCKIFCRAIKNIRRALTSPDMMNPHYKYFSSELEKHKRQNSADNNHIPDNPPFCNDFFQNDMR